MEFNAQDLQKEYYSTTAKQYDNQHLQLDDEHYLALNYLDGIIRFHNFKSILDIGAGTGRAALFLRERNPSLEIISIEPVEALRSIGYAKGLNQVELRDGDVYKLDFSKSSFDLVCAFGVFHHLEYPVRALAEMKRISRHALFISDSNNLGQGKRLSRTIKQVLHALKLWNLSILVKTKGRKYTISEGDGLAYSFSLFSLLKHLKSEYNSYFLSTVPSGRNLFKSASHLAIFVVKKPIKS
jgi:ubiquinone/menaquinone biosynthesis C-methylase UbiE